MHDLANFERFLETKRQHIEEMIAVLESSKDHENFMRSLRLVDQLELLDDIITQFKYFVKGQP